MCGLRISYFFSCSICCKMEFLTMQREVSSSDFGYIVGGITTHSAIFLLVAPNHQKNALWPIERFFHAIKMCIIMTSRLRTLHINTEPSDFVVVACCILKMCYFKNNAVFLRNVCYRCSKRLFKGISVHYDVL